jgi:hypothetical protein
VARDEGKNSNQSTVIGYQSTVKRRFQVSVFRFQDRMFFLTPETRNLNPVLLSPAESQVTSILENLESSLSMTLPRMNKRFSSGLG